MSQGCHPTVSSSVAAFLLSCKQRHSVQSSQFFGPSVSIGRKSSSPPSHLLPRRSGSSSPFTSLVCTCYFQTRSSKQGEEEKLRQTGAFLLDRCHPVLAPKSQDLGVFFVCLFLAFYSSTLYVQCCANFSCTANGLSYAYIYLLLKVSIWLHGILVAACGLFIVAREIFCLGLWASLQL